MKFIEKQAGELLFERIEEVLFHEGLTEKERIPKYRIILEDLFNELTRDVRRHRNGLFAKTSFIFKEATSNPSTAKQRAEFFFNPNRLNVALTRARKKRIVLANKELFSLSPDEGNLKALVRVFQVFYEDACKVEERVLGEDLF